MGGNCPLPKDLGHKAKIINYPFPRIFLGVRLCVLRLLNVWLKAHSLFIVSVLTFFLRIISYAA